MYLMYLLNISKKKNKENINVKNITFDNLDILNAQITRKILFLISLTNATFSII
jgi:hypothetical protein